MSDLKPIFDFLRPHLRDGWNTPGLISGFTSELAKLGVRADEAAPAPPAPPAPPHKPGEISVRIALELIGHEAIVREAYKDSVGVWTWGVGVTNASGHEVYPRYRDQPQSIRKCLEVYVWLLQTKYLPPVLRRFASRQLTEAQLAAALSFHYNTGAILTASWPAKWLAGQIEAAEASFMEWDIPASIIERRQKEADLFFEGKWSADGKARVIPVAKPSYRPIFKLAERVDVRAELEAILGS